MLITAIIILVAFTIFIVLLRFIPITYNNNNFYIHVAYLNSL